MEVTPVLENGAPKLADGKPVFLVDGKEQPLDLADLIDTKGKFETVSQRADRLAREKEEALKPWQGLDAAKVREQLAETEKLRNQLGAQKVGKSDEELEAEIKRRMEKAEADHATQIEALGRKATDAETLAKDKDQLLANELVNAGIATAAAGIPNFTKSELAIAEQQALARSVWRYEDGKMVPRGADGKILYGPDGVTLITYRQWLETKTHLIAGGANGGGSRGGGYDTSGAVVLPRAQGTDPQAYRRAKEEAAKRGVPFQLEPLQ